MTFIHKAFAQANDSIAQTVADKFNFDLANILSWAIGVGALLAVGAIIYGGLMWSVSGMVDKQAEAKEWIWGAVKGLFLLIGAYVILNTINPEILKF